MDKNDKLKLENQICFPLYAASRKITRMYGDLLRPLGLTYTQYIVLLVLWEEEGKNEDISLSVGDVCQRLRLDSGTLTPVFKKLEEKSLVERKRSEEDSRVVMVSLSQKGKDLKEKALEIPEKIHSCVDLPDEDLITLQKILYKFLDQS